MAEGNEMHLSVLQEGGSVQLISEGHLFKCSLCPAAHATSRIRIEIHKKAHLKTALHFKDKIICRCKLPCRKSGHYHCPYCNTTIIRKEHIECHVYGCKMSPHTGIGTNGPPLVPGASQETLLSQDKCLQTEVPKYVSESKSNLSQLVDAVHMDHFYSLPSSFITQSSWGSPATNASLSVITAASTVVSQQPLVLQATSQMCVQCPLCSLVLCRKNLERHIQRHHCSPKDITATSHLKCICVDHMHGIFAVQKVTAHGFSEPIHVQRKTWGKCHRIRCEMEECHQYQLLAQRSGLMHSLCEHIRSLDYCSLKTVTDFLDHNVLKEMMSLNFLGAVMTEICKHRHRAAENACVPLSVLVELNDSPSQLCFSVYEPKIHYFSKLGRVVVTYNSLKNTWHCPCAKPRKLCPHKSIAKWHLFQTRKDLFMTSAIKSETVEDSSTSYKGFCNTNTKRSVKYIYEKKKIPAKLSKDDLAERTLTDYPSKLIPMETCCELCPDKPSLEDIYLVTEKGTIVSMSGIKTDILTYNKRCRKCSVVYRYQEWKDGLHNFNDHVILTLQLCLYLRQGLQTHVSVSKAITCLEKLHDQKFPAIDTIFHAYCHFEALNDTEYTYSCLNCGFYPLVVIMDCHRKGVFNLNVSDLKAPPEDFNGQHNIMEFWDSIQLEMISRGFFPSTSSNPFVVHPCFENWAPWIGRETRSSNSVLNTEFKKVPLETTETEAELNNITEERLLDELLKQKVSTIQKLCKTCSVSTRGSRVDLIIRLREKMKSRHIYDKVFQSVWGAPGGWSVLLCPHGIVYSLKFNLRAEGPRDFADLLLSWKHLPNVCVYDNARGLATHTNLRIPENPPFQPHEGKLTDPTTVNFDDAVQGKLQVSLPWLEEKCVGSVKNGHPITGSNLHYVLYDKFHQANSKDPHDVLRRIDLVPELKGVVNSKVVEQLFADVRKNNYFLSSMTASTHIFLMRNLIEHRNVASNKTLLERQLKRGHQLQHLCNVGVTDLGQAVIHLPHSAVDKEKQELPLEVQVVDVCEANIAIKEEEP
ncbi:hypothetical protein LDENG_00009970 [Lucifuga dentata]|nr:hypothetical protein LDENG_00009970 [Lucifuga dentata]